MTQLDRLVRDLLAIAALPYVFYLVMYAVVRPHASPVEKEPWEPTVSIVLPTYNEEKIVVSKLEDILKLDYPMEKIEVVVVDSSDDSTPVLIKEFFANRSDPKLTLIREKERQGLAMALNEAYDQADNKVVVKTDCDSYVGPNALREATANLSDPDVDGVTGRNAEVLGGSEVERGYRDIQARIQTLESYIDSTFIFHGPFSAFLNDAIVPIDVDSIADDTELALKIRRNGGRVVFDPKIEYKEASHSGFWKRRQQKDRRAMGLLRLLWRQRDMLGRFGMYGRVVLPFNWWFMMVTPWILVFAAAAMTVLSFAIAGPFGAVTPLVAALFILFGSCDRLGSLQSVYSLLDTQFSLVRASVLLLLGKGDGTWDVDEELRDTFDRSD
jgi:cellulose synthase/poly-beta-1,6-N-acetylglucosamine synthase-like glycosyltransferase